jgi:hypothetical protein
MKGEPLAEEARAGTDLGELAESIGTSVTRSRLCIVGFAWSRATFFRSRPATAIAGNRGNISPVGRRSEGL